MKTRKAYLGDTKVKMTIPVLVVAEREIFGRTEFQCVPVGGMGLQWFSAEKFQFVDEFTEDGHG